MKAYRSLIPHCFAIGTLTAMADCCWCKTLHRCWLLQDIRCARPGPLVSHVKAFECVHFPLVHTVHKLIEVYQWAKRNVLKKRRSSTVWGSHSEAAAMEVAAAPVAVLGRLIDNLVEGWEDVVCKLDLCHWGAPHGCCSNSKSHYALRT